MGDDNRTPCPFLHPLDLKRERIARRVQQRRAEEAWKDREAIVRQFVRLPERSLAPYAVDVYGVEVTRLVEWGGVSLGLAPWLAYQDNPRAKARWREPKRSAAS